MAIMFNADEVFEMAIQIEQNGAKFYRKAAELHADQSEYLIKLAEMEDEHEKTFVEMRKDLTDREKESVSYDPDDEAALYLQAMADTHGGEGTPSVAAQLNGEESMEDIIRIALDLEKKSILFYLGLKNLVSKKLGLERIDAIIDEEKNHVAILMAELKKIAGDAATA